MAVGAYHRQVLQAHPSPSSWRGAQGDLVVNLRIALPQGPIALSEVKTAIRDFADQPSIVATQRFLNLQPSELPLTLPVHDELPPLHTFKSLKLLVPELLRRRSRAYATHQDALAACRIICRYGPWHRIKKSVAYLGRLGIGIARRSHFAAANNDADGKLMLVRRLDRVVHPQRTRFPDRRATGSRPAAGRLG